MEDLYNILFKLYSKEVNRLQAGKAFDKSNINRIMNIINFIYYNNFNDNPDSLININSYSAFSLNRTGESAYEIALRHGFIGSESDWLRSLIGETGDAAGFGTVDASVNNTIGIPSVNVQISGPNTAKNIHFTFSNLKGEKGEKGDKGNTGSDANVTRQNIEAALNNSSGKNLSTEDYTTEEKQKLLLIDTKYELPQGGIPETDMAGSVQQNLAKAATAYQKPNSGIPASDLAQGVIPPPEIFMAVYDETSAAEIAAALQAGKIVFCTFQNKIYGLSEDSDSRYCFNAVFGEENTIRWLEVNKQNDVWSANNNMYIRTTERTSAIIKGNNRQSTVLIPSAKALVDSLESGDLTAHLAIKDESSERKPSVEFIRGNGTDGYYNARIVATNSGLEFQRQGLVNGEIVWKTVLIMNNSRAEWDGKQLATTNDLTTLLAGKQDVISDLATIRSGASVGASAYQKPAGGIPATDLAQGVIPDVSQFITNSVDNLVNYYLKSDTYTKDEVAALIGAINQFHYEIAARTSDVTNPKSNVLYLIGPTGSGADKYEEYVYPDAVTGWVKIGDTSIDLSGYVTTTALNNALASYTTTTGLNTLLAGKQDKIDALHKLDYSLLDNTPAIPDAQIQSDWNQGDNTKKDYIKNKPTIPTVPDISTDIATDAASDTKTASPKAVKTYVDGIVGNIETLLAAI